MNDRENTIWRRAAGKHGLAMRAGKALGATFTTLIAGLAGCVGGEETEAQQGPSGPLEFSGTTGAIPFVVG